jgi:L-threonylcarbamoyladenylate synthase
MSKVLIGTDLQYAKEVLEAGQLVAIPTETVYGLGGNALNPEAVSRIFAVKNRPKFDPMIVHTHSLASVHGMLGEVPKQALALAKAFMPGPLTLLLPRTSRIPDIVTAGSPRVAIRIPNHPLTRQLLQSLHFPLAAPSANPFGYISPTRAEHVADQLGDKIPYILDGGPCTVGVESTILGFEGGAPVVYRKGGLAVEAIEAKIGPVEVRTHSTSNPAAPGMLQSHYAPQAPLLLGKLPLLIQMHQGRRIGIISFQSFYPSVPAEQQIVLSPAGDPEEAARNLFAGMRQLDKLELDVILAELLPEQGLGRAINDRLRRAAGKPY